jgi:hypothetical protein
VLKISFAAIHQSRLTFQVVILSAAKNLGDAGVETSPRFSRPLVVSLLVVRVTACLAQSMTSRRGQPA